MKSLLLDLCVDHRHVAPAFLAITQGAFTTDWLAPTAKDEELLALARQLDRVLVTEDADFGDLIFRDRLPPPPGIVLVMTSLVHRSRRQSWIDSLARPVLDVAIGNFVVIGPTRYRFRPLPA